MPKLRVYIGFASATDPVVEETAGTVLDGLYDNPHFPAPPIAKPDLEAARAAFQKAIADAQLGGAPDLAMRENARAALVDLLRELADYVQRSQQDDISILLSSGFKAVNQNRAQRQLEPPFIRKIDNGMAPAHPPHSRGGPCEELPGALCARRGRWFTRPVAGRRFFSTAPVACP